MATWTIWLLGFVALAAALAKLIHLADTGRSVTASARREHRERTILHATEDARLRSRHGAGASLGEDLNDALRRQAPSYDEGRQTYTLPGVEALPEPPR